MNIISICAVGALSALCAAALRRYNEESASLLTVAAVVLLAFSALPIAEGVLTSIKTFSEASYIKAEYLGALIKAVGICFLTQITSDICRDNGSAATASQVELCGRLAILVIACPLYADLLTVVKDFLG